MFGEVEGSRSAGLPRAKPRGVSPSSSKLARSRNQPGLVCLALDKHRRLYSQHVTSRIHSNSLKTNDGRHVYSSQTRGDDLRAFGPTPRRKFHSSFFTLLDRSKLARGSTVQESRSRWLAHRSR
jgi:hypothetical protein